MWRHQWREQCLIKSNIIFRCILALSIVYYYSIIRRNPVATNKCANIEALAVQRLAPLYEGHAVHDRKQIVVLRREATLEKVCWTFKMPLVGQLKDTGGASTIYQAPFRFFGHLKNVPKHNS